MCTDIDVPGESCVDHDGQYPLWLVLVNVHVYSSVLFCCPEWTSSFVMSFRLQRYLGQCMFMWSSSPCAAFVLGRRIFSQVFRGSTP